MASCVLGFMGCSLVRVRTGGGWFKDFEKVAELGDAVGGEVGEGGEHRLGAEQRGVGAGGDGGLEVVEIVADHESLLREDGEFAGDVEDGMGVGFVGRVFTGGDVVEGEAVASEDAAGGVGGVAGEEGGLDTQVVEMGEDQEGAFVEVAGFGGGDFVAVEDFLGALLVGRGELGDVFDDASVVGEADVAADGGEVEEFLGEGAVHVEDDELVFHWGCQNFPLRHDTDLTVEQGGGVKSLRRGVRCRCRIVQGRGQKAMAEGKVVAWQSGHHFRG